MVLNLVLLFAAVVSKFVPLMLTEVPVAPMVGVKLVTVGALLAVTVKDVALDADPLGKVTPIVPVVAEEGTLVTMCVALEEVTVAVTPLKVTVFWLGVVLNPVP